MTVEAMRTYISGMYHSDRWLRRVKLMEDRQVIAIYRTMMKRGQKPQKKRNETKTQQITIFDILREENQNA